MRLYRVEELTDHDTFTGLVTPIDQPPPFPSPAPFGAILDGNLLAEDPPTLPTTIPGTTLIAWSGTLAEESLFERDPRTWMPAGLDALRRTLALLTPPLRDSDTRLLFRPHARHVLCDPQRCLTLLREWRDADAPFGLVLEPAAMLEHDMLDTAEDHLFRAFQALAPIADALLLENVAHPEPAGDDAPPPLQLQPFHRGVLDPAIMTDLIARFVPDDLPVILLDHDLPAQQAILEAARC